MTKVIYYFSGTGNSYFVAERMKESLGDCALVPFAALVSQEKIHVDADEVGLVFPLYYHSLPKIVMDFMKKASFKTDSYIFAVVTRGGGSMQGGALRHVNKLLKAKRQRLSTGFYIQLPDNYIPLLKVPEKEAQEQMFRNADLKLETIVKAILKKESIIESETMRFMKPLMHGYFLSRLSKYPKGFRTTEKCNSCGICEKVCPVKNIKLLDGKPEWENNCQFCLGCIHYCPVEAIEYKKGTKGKKRYHHPEVPCGRLIKANNSYSL